MSRPCASQPTRRATIAGALAVVGARNALAQAPIWRAAQALPLPIQEIYPTAHRGEIWVAGGFARPPGQDFLITDAVMRYAPQTDAWREGPALPRPRHHVQLVSAPNGLLAIGGYEPVGDPGLWVGQTGVWRLAPDAEAWTEVAPVPQPNGETVAAVMASGVHVVGGRSPLGPANANWDDHGDVTNHWRYDPTANQWEAAAPALAPRNSAAGALINGAWHVVGGRTVAGGNIADHEVYDPKEDRWRAAAPMPLAQGGLAAAALNGSLYAFGGEQFEPRKVFEETWIYDPTVDAWRSGPPMATPRHGLGGVSLNGRIWAIGGARQVGGLGTTPTLETLAPA
ncbi:MAG: Kelch repeat-containing protein [Maricaulaceae bacterium]